MQNTLSSSPIAGGQDKLKWAHNTPRCASPSLAQRLLDRNLHTGTVHFDFLTPALLGRPTGPLYLHTWWHCKGARKLLSSVVAQPGRPRIGPAACPPKRSAQGHHYRSTSLGKIGGSKVACLLPWLKHPSKKPLPQQCPCAFTTLHKSSQILCAQPHSGCCAIRPLQSVTIPSTLAGNLCSYCSASNLAPAASIKGGVTL